MCSYSGSGRENRKFVKLLKWYSSKKESGPNLTALAEAKKPKSAGKKRKGVTKKSAKKIKSTISDVDELAWQYPHCIVESQSDRSNTDVTHDSIPNSMLIVSSPQKVDIHSTKEQVTFQPVNAGTLQVNYSNVQIPGPPPIVKSLPLTSVEHSIACPAIQSPHTQYSTSPPPLTRYSDSLSTPYSVSSMPPPHTQYSLSTPAMPPPHTQYSLSSPVLPPPHTQYPPSSPEMPTPRTQGMILHPSASLSPIQSILPPATMLHNNLASLSQLQRPLVETPFWVALLFGNVSRCNGCKGNISRGPDNKPLPPPDNLVLGVAPNFADFNPSCHIMKSKLQPSHVPRVFFLET